MVKPADDRQLVLFFLIRYGFLTFIFTINFCIT